MWKKDLTVNTIIRLLVVLALTTLRVSAVLEPNFVWQNATITTELGAACADISDCYNCSNTYSCHWCSFDDSCHAKGSVHGCSWGASCAPPKPKENTTCASRMTCSDCVLSSHLCHWCAHDNACHAVGSRYGCTTGVDCYANDRCRRSEPEPLEQEVILDIPKVVLISTLLVGSVLLLCLTCCQYCLMNVKGAYDDLATISMAASRPPSMIGGSVWAPSEPFYTALETYPEEDDEGNRQADDSLPLDPPARVADAESPSSNGDDQAAPELQSDPSALLDIAEDSPETSLLIPPSARSFNGIPGMEEPRHMKRLYRIFSCLYCLSVLLICSMMFSILFFYPKPPVYNVCNDAVAWKKIMESLVAFKLDASFEILISVSNPNHLTVVLDNATGSFSFDGNPIGTYMIPSEVVSGMAITDMMLIANVSPDKHQAVQLAEAYYRGKLVLQADFHAKLRVPALFDYTYNLVMSDIDVYVNELGPRDLCHCPSWDKTKQPTTTLPFLTDSEQVQPIGGYQ